MARTVLIAAGGTGGHLFPGIAVADELVRRDAATRVVFAGTPRGLESRLVPRAGYALELLPILPLNGVGLARMLKGLVALPWGLLRSAALVLRLRPAAVLGIGGYAGGPVTLLAALLGVRAVILEPNAKPGFTNRVLKPFARAAACAYEEARVAFGREGGPDREPGARRLRLARAQGAPRAAHPPRLRGQPGLARPQPRARRALPHLPGQERLRIVHQTGPAMRDEVEAAYRAAGRAAEVPAFLDDMERRFGEADLVLSRSGATTCAELTVAGKASILVPFALAADDHQRTNARALEAGGAALVLEEKDLSGEALAAAVRGLVDAPARIAAMEAAARRLGRPDAAARVADLLLPTRVSRGWATRA